MAHRVCCPQCQKELRVGAALLAGMRITCPACQTQFSAGGAVLGQAGASPALAKGSPVRGLGLLLGLSSGVAVLFVLGFTAFVWPGFLRNGISAAAAANQEQARNLLAFAPANSSVVVGVNIGHVRKQPDLQNAWNKLQQYLDRLSEVPREARELLNDADMVLLAGSGGPAGTPVVAVSTEHAFDPAKIKRAAKAGPPREHHGMTICPCGEAIAGKPGCLAFPSDKIAVLGLMPSEQLAKLVARATEPRIHADLQAQINQVSGSVIWGAMQFDADAKRNLQKLEEQAGLLALVIPEIKIIAPIAQRGKGAVITLDLVEQQKIKLSVGFTCHDTADAAQLKAAVQNLWIDKGKMLLDFIGASGGAKAGKLLGEVSQTFELDQRDTSVLLSVQVNQATLEELLNAAPQLNHVGLVPGIK